VILFHLLVAGLLIVDLGLLQRNGRVSSAKAAWLWTLCLALLAAAYAAYTGLHSCRQAALEFTSGYLIEASLSVDNLFVFLLLFRSLRIGAPQQRRVLLWGVLGAIVLRALCIVLGVHLLERFAWIQYLFGAILLLASIRLLRHTPDQESASGPIRWIQTCCLRRIDASRLALPSLLLVILAVEATDLLFALDSIPAVLAVTRNPWIAYTSNIFAILGLRSLYFALASLLDRFRLLHYGLGLILAFVAFKMLAAHWIEIPVTASLAVILAVLGLFLALSLTQKPPPPTPAP
jgi:tellurite resistance protein TerC